MHELLELINILKTSKKSKIFLLVVIYELKNHYEKWE